MSEDTKVAPDAQSLVGASEAASIMDIELSTFSHLRRREAKDGTSKFPTPVAVLRCGPIWKTADIVRFAKKYVAPRPGPKPGAPTPTAKKVATVTKLPVKKAAPKNVSKKVAASNGEGEPKQRKPRKTVAKKVPATV